MSSLFGNPGASRGGSFFPSTTGASQTQGQTNQSQQKPTLSLFGSQPGGGSGGGSLFGGNQNQAQTQGGGNAGGSLFGSSTQQQPQQQPQNNTMFQASTSGVNPQNQPDLIFSRLGEFGTSQARGADQSLRNGPSGSTAPMQPAYFDSLLERSKKRKNAEGDATANLGDMPSLQLGLGDISKRVKELGRRDIGATAGATQSKEPDSRAHYLLAASGVSPGTALRDLKRFNAQAGASASQQAALDTDLDTYVSNLQSQSTRALIEEGLNRAARDFDTFLEENITMEWDTQRRRIYEHFGLVPRGADVSIGPGGVDEGSFGRSARRGRSTRKEASRSGGFNGSVLGTSNMQKSLIGSPAPAGQGQGQASLFSDTSEQPVSGSGLDDRFLKDKQNRFSERVQMLNEARIQGRSYPVLQEFGTIESLSAGTQAGNQLVDAYKALIEITREDTSSQDVRDSNGAYERQFMDDYLDEAPNSKKTMRIRERIIDGSRRFLEKHFFNQLEQIVNKNPREARLGGVPTVLSKVRAYVTLRAARKDLAPDNADMQTLGDEFCWAIIFFLLRSGHVKEAAEYVEENATAFRTIDRHFAQYITLYYSSGDRRLRRTLQDRLNAEYNQRLRIAPENSVDPCRMACYKIIGRCQLNKRNLDLVGQGVEDWIWLQFALAREVNRVDEVAGEVFGLEEVRDVIREIGARHFGIGSAEASSGYGTYFFLQILGGMFEQAIAYLYPFSYVSAVHFSIALDFYGLLRVGSFNASDTELLTYNTKRLPQISFGRMLGYYTRDFRSANVEAAVDYLSLICLNADVPGAGKTQLSLCHEAIRELVLETREFAKLLGDIRSDGRRIQGAIERRLKLIGLSGHEAFLRTVTMQAANVADDNGRTTDAVLLYHLAEQYDNVISIINRALSESVLTDIGEDPLRLQPLKPRVTEPGAATTQDASTQQQQQAAQPAQASLSLTTVDTAPDLARTMMSLYNNSAMYFNAIKPANRDACGVLLRLSEAKEAVESGKWAAALDIIDSLSILPLQAHGEIYAIRSSANAVAQFPPTVASTIGSLLLWTITACGRQRELLRSGHTAFGADVDPTRRAMADDLAGKARDLMVFAGLVKFHLTPRVFDALASAGQEVDRW